MDDVTIPFAQLSHYLQGYKARALPEYSNNKRHVYFAPAMKLYITVRSSWGNAELEFTEDCPCSYDD